MWRVALDQTVLGRTVWWWIERAGGGGSGMDAWGNSCFCNLAILGMNHESGTWQVMRGLMEPGLARAPCCPAQVDNWMVFVKFESCFLLCNCLPLTRIVSAGEISRCCSNFYHSCKCKSCSYKFKSCSYKFKSCSYKFKSLSYKFKSLSYKFKSGSYKYTSCPYKFKLCENSINLNTWHSMIYVHKLCDSNIYLN